LPYEANRALRNLEKGHFTQILNPGRFRRPKLSYEASCASRLFMSKVSFCPSRRRLFPSNFKPLHTRTFPPLIHGRSSMVPSFHLPLYLCSLSVRCSLCPHTVIVLSVIKEYQPGQRVWLRLETNSPWLLAVIESCAMVAAYTPVHVTARLNISKANLYLPIPSACLRLLHILCH
jgi:hypothetical protein